MANKKLTDLTELTTPADNDFLYIVDVSDTTESAQGTSKKIRKDKVDSGASKENIANKSDIYTTDTEKYYSASYINGVLPTDYSKVVYMNANTPALSTIFDTNNPPVTNDDLLKNDTANLYIGANASTWVYKTGTGYQTEIINSATSNFNTFGTTVDAGNSKTSHITRSGATTLTGPLNILNLKIATTPTTSAGSYDVLTRNSSTTALEKISSTSLGNWTLASNNISNNNMGNVLIGATDAEGSYSRLAIKGKVGTDNIFAWVNNSGTLKGRVDFEGTLHANQVNSTGLNTTGNLYLSTVGNGLTGNNSGTTLFVTRNTYWESNRKIDYSVDLSSTYTTRSLVDKAYTDAKITQTITNGVTDKSPSEDAVFDALALKTGGSGTTNYLPKFTSSGTIGNSQIFDSGTNISIGAVSSAYKLRVKGGNATTLQLDNGGENYTELAFANNGVDKAGNIYNLAANNYQIVNKTAGRLSLGISDGVNLQIAPSGSILIAKTVDDGISTNKLQVNGNVKATQFRISDLNTAPASATDTGTLGEVRITSTYIYICTATNTWVRTALTTW